MTISDRSSRFPRNALSFCAALLAVVMFAAPAAAATLKIATLSPEGSVWMKVLRQHGKEIEKRTGGSVKMKFYPGGVMGDDKAVLRKMRVGQLHGAVVTAGGLIQVYPDIGLYNLPMLFADEAEVDAVRQVMDERLMAGLRKKKFVGFGIAEVGFAYPMTQQPATSVAQLRQSKVWTPDNDIGALRGFEAFEISPIPLPMADVLAGLQTGLIDSVASPPIGTIALQWHTQVGYGLDVPLIYVYGLFALTERQFNRLSEAEQAIVREEMMAAVAAVDRSARADHTNAKAALLNQGIEWLKPSAAEAQEWSSLAAVARDDLVASGYVSAQIYQQTQRVLEEYRSGAQGTSD